MLATLSRAADTGAEVGDSRRDERARLRYRKTMVSYFLVFLGAGIGGSLRHGINLASVRIFGLEFPWATLIINVTGSVLMGLMAGYFAFKATGVWTQHWRLFVTTGVLGGFTTFSTFSLDAILLWERGSIIAGAAYVVASVALSFVGLFGGLALVKALT
jgi:CrcB protein